MGGLMVDLDFFPSVNLIISKACRMRCSFCCAETSKYKDSMVDLENLFKIIDILYENGTKRICFSGGEPLLNPHLDELLSYAYDYGMINIIMSSDGKAIQKCHFDSKLVDTFWISVHGIKEAHEKITNINGSFDDIEFALSHNKHNYPFAIWSVVTPDNVKFLDELINWCIEHHIKRMYLSNLNETGKGKDFVKSGGRINDREFEKIIVAYQKKFQDKLIISGQRFSKNAQCTLIYSDGSVYITPYDNNEDQLLVGNILEEDAKEAFSRLKADPQLWEDYTYRYQNSTINK